MAILRKRTTMSDGDAAIELMRSVDPLLVLDAIAACMDLGYVISFGRTRNGDAAAISIYDGKEQEREYPRATRELEETLQIIIELSSKVNQERKKRKESDKASSRGGIRNLRQSTETEKQESEPDPAVE